MINLSQQSTDYTVEYKEPFFSILPKLQLLFSMGKGGQRLGRRRGGCKVRLKSDHLKAVRTFHCWRQSNNTRYFASGERKCTCSGRGGDIYIYIDIYVCVCVCVCVCFTCSCFASFAFKHMHSTWKFVFRHNALLLFTVHSYLTLNESVYTQHSILQSHNQNQLMWHQDFFCLADFLVRVVFKML